MQPFQITVPALPAAIRATLLKIAEAHCKALRELGYDATVEEHGDGDVRLHIYRDTTCLVDEVQPLTADYVAELSRFAGAAYFQHTLDDNYARLVEMGWKVTADNAIPLVTIERNGDEPLKYFPTYSEAAELLKILDFSETEWLMGKFMKLFHEVGWRRGINTDMYVLLKSDGRGFNSVALNDPDGMRKLIEKAQDELSEQQAAKISAEMAGELVG